MTSLTTSTVQVVVADNLENQLYDVAKKWIKGEELSAVTLIPLATELMAVAQKKTTKGNGARKKQAVITVITRIIEDFVPEDKYIVTSRNRRYCRIVIFGCFEKVVETSVAKMLLCLIKWSYFFFYR